MDEFVFPSHTSVISKRLLIDELAKIGLAAPTESSSTSTKKNKNDQNVKVDRVQEKIDCILSKKVIKDIVLEDHFETGLPEGEKPLKRV
jgi:hypothetical protein